MICFENFVTLYEERLNMLYTIFTKTIETNLQYDDFCRFVYKKTFFSI
jgi:hypothetical protein